MATHAGRSSDLLTSSRVYTPSGAGDHWRDGVRNQNSTVTIGTSRTDGVSKEQLADIVSTDIFWFNQAPTYASRRPRFPHKYLTQVVILGLVWCLHLGLNCPSISFPRMDGLCSRQFLNFLLTARLHPRARRLETHQTHMSTTTKQSSGQSQAIHNNSIKYICMQQHVERDKPST
jgi:hypothetical protein